MLEPDDAIQKLVAAIELVTESTPAHELSGLYQALGQKYSEKGEYSSAVTAFEKANFIRVNSRNLSGGATLESDFFLFSGLVFAYTRLEDYKKAIGYSELLLRMTANTGIPERYVEALYHHGRVLFSAGKTKKARDVFKDGLAVAQKHNVNTRLQSHFGEWLAAILWEQRNYKLSVEQILDYYQFCAEQRLEPIPFAIVAETDEVQGEKPPASELIAYEENPIHLLTLPRSHKPTSIEKWIEEVIKRRPELQDGIAVFYNTSKP